MSLIDKYGKTWNERLLILKETNARFGNFLIFSYKFYEKKISQKLPNGTQRPKRKEKKVN